MSAQTPQRIDKIPDREDLETEIRMLKALCEELKGSVLSVANSCAFVAPSLPAKQRPAIEQIAKELYAALKKAQKDI
jgi:hypothetical protein